MAKKPKSHTLRSFFIELLVYAALVVAYVLFVIGLLSDRLHEMYSHHTTWYALTALVLIIAQGVVLEFVTSLLLRLVRTRLE